MSQIVVIDTRTIRSSHFICLLLVLFSRDHFVWVTKFKCYDSWFTPLIYYRFTDISSIYAAIRYLLKTTESKVSIDLYFASLNSVRSSSINMCTLHSAHTQRSVRRLSHWRVLAMGLSGWSLQIWDGNQAKSRIN